MTGPRRKPASPNLGAAGGHQGRGLTPDDYEAMLEDSEEGGLEALLGLDSEQAKLWDARIEAQMLQSERDIADAMGTRVNFRWGKEQVATVKRAAELAGVPYQTYIKLVTYRGAVADLQAASQVGGLARSAATG